MKMLISTTLLLAVAYAPIALAALKIDMVTVGNPGNAPDTRVMNDGTSGYGSVPYEYQIGKFEITCAQYTEFLNSVAQTDNCGLYFTSFSGGMGSFDCPITRSGAKGSYAYSIASAWANRPVNYVSWGSAIRFCNWMHNGQPVTHVENASTTEDGAYLIDYSIAIWNGGTPDVQDLMIVTRKSGAKWWLPSENEWYKAAYHNKAAGVAASYYNFPTSSNSTPSKVVATPDPGNNACYTATDIGIGAPYYRTEVGTFSNSDSPYGTFDQGGNISEWTDTKASDVQFVQRGGSYYQPVDFMAASYRGNYSNEWHPGTIDGSPAVSSATYGFRVACAASVPEPGGIALLLCGAIALTIWRFHRKKFITRFNQLWLSLAAVIVFSTAINANAIDLEMVTVGDPGNKADTRVMDDGTTGYGSVPYTYQIGKYDVTVSQYTAFLNAVAKTDTYGLYYSGMATAYENIKINQSGSPGSYSYSVGGSYSAAANCPMFDVSWASAARFCNWLQNGQPAGNQGPGTTETGAYTINGLNTIKQLMKVTRNADAAYFIPTENEWYKAAYYKGGGTNAEYWLYSTKSNTAPSYVLSQTGTNNANYSKAFLETSDPINRLTPVGYFAGSPGPYGTFDMGGNIGQWNEGILPQWDERIPYDTERCIRGGNAYSYISGVAATSRTGIPPKNNGYGIGFRVAASAVPEPGGIVLMLCGAVAGSIWLRRRL
jgi:formylglycine-generating enzyme required for sulfatase activity